MKTYYSSVQNRLLSHLRFTSVLVVACFALLPNARALLPPPVPDGGYLNGNTAEGQNALFSLTTGVDNTAVGFVSLRNNTTGGYNTATGAGALFKNITGSQNTANGAFALVNNSSGNNNTANGMLALQANTIGNDNTANGWQALASNISGIQNTATGAEALQHNTTGNSNTANGVGALKANTTSFGNTASGFVALFANTTGGSNTANGAGALQSNTNGGGNVASGFQALMNNTTGGFNTALGYQAGLNLTTGSHNVYIGQNAVGIAGENNRIRISENLPTDPAQSACYIGGIHGQDPGFPSNPVYIGFDGKLGINASSKRFKEHIRPMDQASEAILALKPVTFHYKSDKTNTPQFGLVAEDVAEVNPDLVVRDKDDQIYSVRYDAVNAMLLNEFLKEHRRVKELEATVALQQKGMEVLTAQFKQHTAQIQKVSAQLKLSKSSPQTVLNNQ